MRQIILACLLASMLAATGGCGILGGCCCGVHAVAVAAAAVAATAALAATTAVVNDCCNGPRLPRRLGIWNVARQWCATAVATTAAATAGRPCRQTGCQPLVAKGQSCGGCCDSCGDDCCERPWHRGPLSCLFALATPRCWACQSCGRRYWGDFYSDPPDCWDPCDCHGNYTAAAGTIAAATAAVTAAATAAIAAPAIATAARLTMRQWARAGRRDGRWRRRKSHRRDRSGR